MHGETVKFTNYSFH